jgi:hypothetical protein
VCVVIFSLFPFLKNVRSKYLYEPDSYKKSFVFIKRKWQICLACIAKSYTFATAFQETESGEIEMLKQNCGR